MPIVKLTEKQLQTGAVIDYNELVESRWLLIDTISSSIMSYIGDVCFPAGKEQASAKYKSNKTQPCMSYTF